MEKETLNKELKKIFLQSFLLFGMIVGVISVGIFMILFKANQTSWLIFGSVGISIWMLGAVRAWFLLKKIKILKELDENMREGEENV